MEHKKLFLFIFFIVFLFSSRVSAQELLIGTYNLRYDNKNDTGNLWVDRAPVVVELLRFHDFDIFGTQEALKNQLDDVAKGLPQYLYFGVGRDNGQSKGEHSAIFYKKDKFKVLNKGDFWLSQTPEKPSLGWDATCCNRICSWAQFQDLKSGKKFYFFNAHFDHQGMQARRESAKLILKKAKEIAGNNPVIFTGDLNGDHQSGWYKELAASDIFEDSYSMVKYPYANNASFNAFGKALNQNGIIDHIFVSKHFAVDKWGVLTDSYHGKFPSDHFPVLAKMRFK